MLEIISDLPAKVGYPPPPWQLTGHLYGSLWSLKQPEQITVELPPEIKLMVTLGRASAFVGFVDYRFGSTLIYHELITGLAAQVKRKAFFSLTVPFIWVDSIPSLWGGREIWGVPKELAEFQYDYSRNGLDLHATATSHNQILATSDFHSVAGLPRNWRVPVPFPNVQMLHGQAYKSSGLFSGSIQICKGGITVPTDSPLAALGVIGHKPLISFAGLNFSMNLKAAKPLKRS